MRVRGTRNWIDLHCLGLIEIAKNTAVSPEEKMIKKLLDDAPPIQVELGSLQPS